jgi:hypothetical protein
MIKTQRLYMNFDKNQFIPPPPHRISKQNFLIFLVLFIIFDIISCDFFTGPKVDLFRVISNEVDWANAPKLTVTVAFPPEWGNSPQSGEGKCGDTRKGYEFGVEFIPLPSYGFEKWLAFKTEGFADWFEDNKHKSSYDADVADYSLDGDSVTITESISDTGARTAKVKIDTLEPVMLVPWCSERLKVTQSNPPLINTGMSYSRGQQIKIWFNIDIYCENNTIPFGENTINIIGQNLDDIGSLYNEDGDVTAFFNEPVYDSALRTVTIQPKTGIEAPPENIIIFVTVGTGIPGKNGEGLIAPVIFSYRTNTMLVNNVYYAENVWAAHNPSTVSDEDNFFYRGAPTGRDRRLRKNGGRYEVTLYFKVTRSSSEIIEPQPEKIQIAEIAYASITGGERDVFVRQKDWACAQIPSAGLSGADFVYRQNNLPPSPDTLGTYYYKVTYYWDEDFGKGPDDPGIIRLVVMPYRDGPNGASIDNWRNAMAEGRFVAVALDNEPPGGTSGGDAVFTLSGQSNIDTSDVYNYNNSTYKNFTISANFTKIADNGMEGGIRQTSATRDKPWTMDSQSDIEWQYKIAGAAPSSWFPLTESNKSVDLTTKGLSSSTTPLNIEVRYRDKLENESLWIDTEKKIRYFSPSFTSVSAYSATYNENQNTITVAWSTPGDMGGVELQIDDRLPQTISGTGSKTYNISNVPHIDASGVTSGEPVSNVVGYTISLTAYNNYGRADTVVYKIWNIPNMTVSKTVSNNFLAEEIKSQADLAGIVSGDSNKKYVLTQDITLTGIWTPISDFRGKFYGNGHTITVGTGFSFSTSPSEHNGIFGNVSGGFMEIHDLCVEYKIDVLSSKKYTGGIMGGVAGVGGVGVRITNCIVMGEGTLKASGGYLGGIIGYSAFIENCYSSLNVEIINGSGDIYVGGIAGYFSGRMTTSDYSRDVNNINFNGDVTCEITGSGDIYVGGIVGYYIGAGNIYINKLSYSGGIINVKRTSATASGSLYVGGIAGNSGGNIGNCLSDAIIDVDDDGSRIVYVGGIVGYQRSNQTSINNCSYIRTDTYKGETTFIVKSKKAGSSYVGGIVGQAHSLIIRNCRVGVGSITEFATYSSAGNIYMGGIGGYLSRSSNVENCNVSYLGPSVTSTSNGMIYVGGIAGYINYYTDGVTGNGRVTLTNCSLEDVGVYSTGKGEIYAGGLVGYVNGNSSYIHTITGCKLLLYEVQATSNDGSGNIYTGGLVGKTSYGSIKNCYVTKSNYTTKCEVTGNKNTNNGEVYTGGIAGYAENSTVQFTISINCSVTSKINGASGKVESGGIIGYHKSGTFANNAALGLSVIARGGQTQSAGRIYGSSEVTSSKNYAIDTMLVRANADYNDNDNGATVSFSDHTSLHGKGTPISDFRRADFWSDIGTDGLAFNTKGTGTGIGDLDYIWDFNIVTGRGYPSLVWELE